MKLIIEDDEGHKTTVPFVREEITVGRQDGNTIRLTERNVSRKHARFFRKSGGVFVEDLRSHNGIRVNGDRIESAIALKEGDLVQIGDYDLAVQDEQVATKPPDSRATVKMDALPDIPSADSSDDSAPTSNNVAKDVRAQSARSKTIDESPDEVERDPSKPAAPAPRAQATAVVNLNGIAEREVTGSPPPPAPPGADIAPHEAPHLVMVSTELAGREFACLRTVLTIGRGDDCDIPIEHRSLSREHARLERRGAQWSVVDMGSPNKVKVNDEEYADTVVNDGDIITLGHVKLRFVGAGEEYTYVPEGARKRSPALIAGVGVVVVAAIGAGVYFGVIRKQSAGDQAAPENPKAPPPAPSLIPKTELVANEPSKAATPPPSPVPAPAAAPDTNPKAPAPDLKAAEPAKTPDDVVVPAPDLHAAPEVKEAKAPRREEHKPERNAHVKPEPHVKATQVAAVAPPPEPSGPTPQDQANALRAEANTLMSQGQYDVAITKLRQALKLSPNDPQLHKSLGGCLANSGEMDQAAKEYQRFIDLAPNSPEVPNVKKILDAYQKMKGGG